MLSLFDNINKSEKQTCPFPTGILHVYLSRLRKNIETIRSRAIESSGNKNLKFLLPVKANAYGHGMIAVSTFVQQEKLCDYLGVAHLTEAHALRNHGIAIPILVHGQISSDVESLKYVVESDIEIEISEPVLLKKMQDVASRIGKTAKIHLSVDTGMGRTGALPENTPALLHAIATCENIHLAGVMTHFSVADEKNEEEKAFTRNQIETFKQVKDEVQKQFHHYLIFHASNSAGTESYQEGIFDMIRPGIASYGYGEDVEPVMELTTSLTLVKTFPPEHPIGYGRTYNSSDQNRKFGIIPIGYGDGLSRALSNKAEFIVNGSKRRLAGRISMDQCSIELDGDDTIGDEVVILGKQGKISVNAADLAKRAGTISYEILCFLGNAKRLRHEYH